MNNITGLSNSQSRDHPYLTRFENLEIAYE